MIPIVSIIVIIIVITITPIGGVPAEGREDGDEKLPGRAGEIGNKDEPHGDPPQCSAVTA